MRPLLSKTFIYNNVKLVIEQERNPFVHKSRQNIMGTLSS